MGIGQDQPIDPALQQGADHATRLGFVVVIGSDEKGVSVVREYRLRTGVDRGKQRIHQIGHDHPDGQRPIGAEPAGKRVRSIAEALSNLDDAHRGLLVDHRAGLGIEGARCGRHVNAGLGGNFLECDGLRHDNPRAMRILGILQTIVGNGIGASDGDRDRER